MLEAGGRNYLQNSRWLLTGIPERMPLIARLENQVADVAVDDFVAEQCTDATFEYVTVLILTRMTVQGRTECSRRNWMLDERKSATGIFTVDHEAHTHRAENPGLAVFRPQFSCGWSTHRSFPSWSVRLLLSIRLRVFGSGS